LTVKFNSGTEEGKNLFTYDGSTEKSINIAPGSIGAPTVKESQDYTDDAIDDALE
jgi:hypothetical protein